MRMRLAQGGRRVLRLYALFLVSFVAVSFIAGSFIYPRLEEWTGLRVSPEFSGGRVLAVFRDAYGDDDGEGDWTYPDHPFFRREGGLDLLKYTVYEPQVHPRWQSMGAFWQLGVTLAHLEEQPEGAAGFAGTEVRIYLDVDGAAGGERPMPGTGVQAQSAFPWDWMIRINGNRRRALLTAAGGSSSGKKGVRIPLLVVPEQQSLYVRIPLDSPERERLLGGGPVRHYVMTGVADPYAEGGLQPVKRSAGRGHGGGALSRRSPRVWDLVLPLSGGEGLDQAEILSAPAEGRKRWAEAVPVLTELPGREALGLGAVRRGTSDKGGTGRNEGGGKASLEALAEELETARNRDREALEERLSGSLAPALRGALLFQAGRQEEARELLDEVLETAPEGSPRAALAWGYQGCLTAVKGGKATSPGRAMRLVNRGIEQLDEALSWVGEESSGVQGGDGYGKLSKRQVRLHLLIARASVAVSVPEGVFSLSASGAENLEEAAGLAGSEEDNLRQRGDLWARAALAWERAGRKDRADLAWIRAASFRGESPLAAYEAAKRGY